MLAVTEPASPCACRRPLPRAVAVAIPALNEEASIADVVAGIPRTLASHIIVADGGSRDATAARARAAGAQVIDAGKGYGRACWRATKAAHGADIMVFMDGDGADDPASLAALIAPICAGRYDFVIGSRARGERAPGSIAWHQLAAGTLAGWAMRALYGVRYTDMCAFRAIRRQLLLRSRHARDGLWLEHRNADARRARRIAHSGNSCPLSLPDRRQLEGGRQPARNPAGRSAHPGNLLAGRDRGDRSTRARGSRCLIIASPAR